MIGDADVLFWLGQCLINTLCFSMKAVILLNVQEITGIKFRTKFLVRRRFQGQDYLHVYTGQFCVS